jgi:hypothetical protein
MHATRSHVVSNGEEAMSSAFTDRVQYAGTRLITSTDTIPVQEAACRRTPALSSLQEFREGEETSPLLFSNYSMQLMSLYGYIRFGSNHAYPRDDIALGWKLRVSEFPIYCADHLAKGNVQTMFVKFASLQTFPSLARN